MSGERPDPADAIVYAESAFNTPNGKTAHGLVRYSRRFRVLSVVCSTFAGRDAGEILDGRPNGIPIAGGVRDALAAARASGGSPTEFVIGLAPDGGRLPAEARRDVAEAIRAGLNVVSGLHDFLSDDPELAPLAKAHRVTLLDVRRPPERSRLHFFTGKIDEVTAKRIAVLGTDSAIGKRTTAVRLVEAFEGAGYRAELIGTGQTAWMQGVRYGIIMDSLINDFVAGEIEHVVWTAWREARAELLVIEGQGSLMNPAYPGGFEILAAGRPHAVVLQHAPSRKEYDGFPGYPLHPLPDQIRAIEMLSGRRVVAITVNHEGLDAEATRRACEEIRRQTGLPAIDVLLDGAEPLLPVLTERLRLGRRTA